MDQNFTIPLIIAATAFFAVALVAAFALGRLGRRLAERKFLKSRIGTVEDLIERSGQLVRNLSNLREAADKKAQRARPAPWGDIPEGCEKAFAAFLSELPDTDAVIVLAFAPREPSAKALEQLSEERATRLLIGLAKFEGAPLVDIERVADALRDQLILPQRRYWPAKNGTRSAARLLWCVDGKLEATIMENIKFTDATLETELRSSMFTFDEICYLDPASIQILLRNVEKDKLALALRGPHEQVLERFMENMSERSRDFLKEDMEAMGPVKLRDIDDAQTYICETAKELAEIGEIKLPRGSAEDLLY